MQLYDIKYKSIVNKYTKMFAWVLYICMNSHILVIEMQSECHGHNKQFNNNKF